MKINLRIYLKLWVLPLMVLVLSCTAEKNPILDFSDPFGDSSEESHPVPALKDSQRPILISEQSEGQVVIIDSLSKGVLWNWKASEHLNSTQAAWFKEIDEAKAVYQKQYILLTASSGGVALVRISDKKLMFYTRDPGNPHSAELLPDGNIVMASSIASNGQGDALKLYKVDSLNAYVAKEHKRYNQTFAHNVVWDYKRNILWSTDDQNLYTFTYENNGGDLSLTKGSKFYTLPDRDPHDMFPVYGKEELYLTTSSKIYIFDINSGKFMEHPYSKRNIKSISDGPAGFGTIIVEPTTSYWTNRIINIRGSSAFFKDSYKMYKARWFIHNPFSYPSNHNYKQTN
ncbi:MULTISPECIES: DUF6528 family protein [Sphingobacterium]|uniref:DUF6528 family protein n=1 Tax=Sphingobacterium TaxID=28453 RepID=UPI0013DA28A2|nr:MULTISPECIES: DUF6528 family protein [unclassified Sphingobacterium]